jgi:hypothetical protein
MNLSYKFHVMKMITFIKLNSHLSSSDFFGHLNQYYFMLKKAVIRPLNKSLKQNVVRKFFAKNKFFKHKIPVNIYYKKITRKDSYKENQE